MGGAARGCGAMALPVPRSHVAARAGSYPPPGWGVGVRAELELEVLQICSWYLPLLVAQGDNLGGGRIVPQSPQRHVFIDS